MGVYAAANQDCPMLVPPAARGQRQYVSDLDLETPPHPLAENSAHYACLLHLITLEPQIVCPLQKGIYVCLVILIRSTPARFSQTENTCLR